MTGDQTLVRPSPRLRVVAGALFDRKGRVLIAKRPAGRHQEGRWEFPGGKMDPGESEEQALARELAEELGVALGRCEKLVSLEHAYPDRIVELHLHLVHDYSGEARGLDGQALRWVPLGELGSADILEADRPFIEALQRRGPPAR